MRPSDRPFFITDFEELYLPTPDRETLCAFYIRASYAKRSAKHAKTTVLMFHGNAGNIGHRIPIAQRLIGSLGCNVLMLEYRGYGLSTGEPDQEGLMLDAQAGYDYLRSRAETRDHDIIVYGQSLGGAVATQLVAKNQRDRKLVGLILENTFLSIRKLIPSYVFPEESRREKRRWEENLMGNRIMPPAKYLAMFCHQIWPSENVIPIITEVPILFLSAQQDEIVPPAHMRKLYELSQSPTKIWKAFPTGDHNSCVAEEGYFEAIYDFVVDLG
ncbi:Alpha/Beta hydrolase protein [Calycina marina]|uniref:Alpha/Beta hydrolase protein n=1 Tax=Calycina marina TaxID=1763456 RepID=A0A9P7Z981_9HELO|nr:Alpha/Beta hydrolase protein [Calycina marina]